MFTIEKKAMQSAADVGTPMTETEKELIRRFDELTPAAQKNALRFMGIIANYSGPHDDLKKWMDQHGGLTDEELSAAIDKLEQEMEAATKP